MTDPDYTNDRWHVDGPTVTHKDFPGAQWNFVNRENAEDWAQFQNGIGHYATTHAARAWLAAQPKPEIKDGMRIRATLRGGAVVEGIAHFIPSIHGEYAQIVDISGAPCRIPEPSGTKAQNDIIDWHEVTE